MEVLGLIFLPRNFFIVVGGFRLRSLFFIKPEIREKSGLGQDKLPPIFKGTIDKASYDNSNLSGKYPNS